MNRLGVKPLTAEISVPFPMHCGTLANVLTSQSFTFLIYKMGSYAAAFAELEDYMGPHM